MPKKSKVLAALDAEENNIRQNIGELEAQLAVIAGVRARLDAAPKPKKPKEDPRQTKMPGVA